MPELPAHTYKICARAAWEQAKRDGTLPLSEVDRKDGYVHLSLQDQVDGTLTRHFAGKENLVLLCVATAALRDGALRLESSRDGKLFPHLYGELGVDAVIEVTDLEPRPASPHES